MQILHATCVHIHMHSYIHKLLLLLLLRSGKTQCEERKTLNYTAQEKSLVKGKPPVVFLRVSYIYIYNYTYYRKR